jgi:hypothetical protein
MGINCQDLNMLIKLKEDGYLPQHSSVIEIGAQQLDNSFLRDKPQIEKIGQLFNVTTLHPLSSPLPTHIAHGNVEHQHADAPFARDFWQWLGFTYASIDIDGSPFSIPLDLNYDQVPKHKRGKYHLVTNFGTTEHVANQLNAFKVIHDLTSVDGIMMHHLPAQGMMNHGLVNYNLKFFWMLARSNGYKWLFADYKGGITYYDLPQNIVDCVASSKPDFAISAKELKTADCAIMVVMKKVYDTPYVPPLDVNTGTKTDNKTLKKRYWSVFNEDPFDRPHKHLDAKNFPFYVIKKIKSRLSSLKRSKKTGTPLVNFENSIVQNPSMEIIAVGTGRDGTTSLTKWFNDLFELNKIKKTAIHEPYCRESYNAYYDYLTHFNDSKVNEVITNFKSLQTNVAIGNGYASILPYFTNIPSIKTLIHLKRDKEKCVDSLIENANLNPSAYLGYVDIEDVNSNDIVRRTTAVDIKESTNDDWNKLTLREKLSWYYDYTHNTINDHKSLFDNYIEINTEDLNDSKKMEDIANHLFGKVDVPHVSKLNSHRFVDINSFENDYKIYIQWLLGNIDWKKVANDPSYLVMYAMNRFETWIGWCESNDQAHISMCEKNYMDSKQIKILLEETLPKLQKSMNTLNGLK